MLECKVKPLDYAALEALVRHAQAERSKVLGDWIARGGKAMLRAIRALGGSVRALHDGERRRSFVQARAAVEKWAGRY